jgi:Cu(I)/Ag(I) efflux system membrane fusion protein/cobalt-zinc-cadmium efflux system membrane fusion protein
MMRSSIAGRFLSILFGLTISILVVTAITGIRTSVVGAQDSATGTPKKPKVTLTTDPSPAQKGTNTVRIKLSDPTGHSISGAEVTVTFFMPAMPSMGMAEMKTVIKGTDKGGGMYEGKGDLGSGGMWQVTITARKNRETIATEKLTVKATGGM